jgi:hypothetical protein
MNPDLSRSGILQACGYQFRLTHLLGVIILNILFIIGIFWLHKFSLRVNVGTDHTGKVFFQCLLMCFLCDLYLLMGVY